MRNVDQQPMWWENELTGLGIDPATVLVHARVGARLLEPGIAEWRLLAQIDTDEDLGMFWGDTGWWLRELDFAAGRVERCWGVVQVT
jgi:hypothetical protein